MPTGLLGRLPGRAGLVTVLDGHPATLSWLAGVRRHRIEALGVDEFGRSGDLPDIYPRLRSSTTTPWSTPRRAL